MGKTRRSLEVEARVECAACVLSACVSAIGFLLSDLEPSQRPELLLAEDFPVILQLTADSPSPLFPSLPLSFTSGTDVNSEVGGDHVFLLPPSLRGGADSLIPTPYSHKQRVSVPLARDKLLLQNGDTKRSYMASVLIRRAGNIQQHSPVPSIPA